MVAKKLKLVELARQKPRYGYRRLRMPLQRQGHLANVKRNFLIPMVGMPPDFLDIESDPAAEVNRGVFLAHTKVLVVLESLK
jgi:hypothetical protein